MCRSLHNLYRGVVWTDGLKTATIEQAMSFDQKQNTEALQERFPEVYRKFFAENDLVVSFDYHVSLLAGTLDRLVGAPVIYLKLPFRGYVGLQKNNRKNELTLGHSLTYDNEDNAFKETDLSTLRWSVVVEYLQRYSERFGGVSWHGCTLNFLFEMQNNLGFDDGSSVGIIIALQLYGELLETSTISEMVRLGGDEIQQNESAASRRFNAIRKEALKLTALFTGGFPSGSSGFTSFIDSRYPIVHFTEERRGSMSKPYEDVAPLDYEGQLDQFDQLNLWGFRLNELVDISGALPLDVVSIHFRQGHEGYPSRFSYVNKVMLPSFDELRDFTKHLFRSVKINGRHAPVFLKHLDIDGGYFHGYVSGKVHKRLFFLKRLVELYQKHLSTSASNQFLEALNAFINADTPFEESYSPQMRDLIRRLFDKAQQTGVVIGLRTCAWGKQDSNVLVFSKPRSFREPLFEFIEEMRSENRPGSCTDFVSWRDGWGKEGIRVEQFISKGIYSKFVGSQSYRVREWDEKSGEMKRVTEDVEKTKGEFDILLDKVDGKIYIKGEECTSRELPTQKAAIEVLVYLLEHQGETASNKTLPAQTYTRYRNEFQGKIVTPLNQLLKKRLGKDLGLKIHGKLMVFDVQFDPIDLKIGILEKVG